MLVVLSIERYTAGCMKISVFPRPEINCFFGRVWCVVGELLNTVRMRLLPGDSAAFHKSLVDRQLGAIFSANPLFGKLVLQFTCWMFLLNTVPGDETRTTSSKIPVFFIQ